MPKKYQLAVPKKYQLAVPKKFQLAVPKKFQQYPFARESWAMSAKQHHMIHWKPQIRVRAPKCPCSAIMPDERNWEK